MTFAVHKTTKEHRVWDCRSPLPFPHEWRIVEADADGWIKWDRKDVPLPNGCAHEVKTKSGYVFPRTVTEITNWRSDSSVDFYRPILDAKPEAPAWDGEGLPPVGMSVEVMHNGRWLGATTVGEFGSSRRSMVCAPNGGGFYGFYPEEIRPLRSEEDKAVKEMRDFLNETFKAPNKKPSRTELCRALYAAGYRKTGGE